MINPPSSDKPAPIVRRAVAHVPSNALGPVVIVTPKAAVRLTGHREFLRWLTDPDAPVAASQVWLTPSSVDWARFAPALMDHGYRLALTKRAGEYAGLRVTSAGWPVGGEAEITGRTWQGRSAAGLVTVDRKMTQEDQARDTWEQLEAIDAAIRETWPGATLGPSIASTAMECFRRHLSCKCPKGDRSQHRSRCAIGCSWTISKQIRTLGAYGGGRIEMYYPKGSTFTRADVQPFDIDIRSAYPTAMQTVPIPADFLDIGPESAWSDDCTISTALVEVPGSLRYPPLRVPYGGEVFYPTGVLFGAWTSAELRAAEAVGCTILEIHSVLRFEARPEFADFAARAVDFRRAAPRGGPVEKFAKGLSVQFVGALASRPSVRRITTNPKSMEGVRIDRPGIYEEECSRPSEREILSAAATITGTVRAWMARAAKALQDDNTAIVYIHTDGAGTIGNPDRALRACAAAGGPPLEAWEVAPLETLEVWAANQRIATHSDGTEDVAAGGLSRSPTAKEVRDQLKIAVSSAEATAWQSAKRRDDGEGSTRPLRYEEIDPVMAEKTVQAAEMARLERTWRAEHEDAARTGMEIP